MYRRRPLLRSAVLGGGAYLAGKSAARRTAEQAQREAEVDTRIDGLEAAGRRGQPAVVPGPRPGQAAEGPDMLGQLTTLVQLHEKGALTDEEFAAAKARLLG
ncbi:MAG: SHOCT domain-containing protein [Trebonia sp.]